MPKKTSPSSINQTAFGNDNIQVVGSNNVITRITNYFAGGVTQKRALRYRHAMLERVKNTWIEGVLEKSLYRETLLQLKMEGRPGAVDPLGDMKVQMPDPTNVILPAGTSIIEVFDKMEGAVLILGEPGSGKTTTLLELGRDCIARAEEDESELIPVIFNLSSWSNPKVTLDDWLIKELNTKYAVSKKLAESWVTDNDLLLLLDGLDEVRLDFREACVQAINNFYTKHGFATPIAVCSRVADYEALNTKLKLGGAVQLQPLTSDQIDEYFEKAGAQLAGAHQTVSRDEILQELVKRPLMLGILTLAYSGGAGATLELEQGATVETRRRQLLDTYIQQMFERVARTRNKAYSAEQTRHWLSWLSRKMIEHNQVLYLLENMQPSWLSRKKQGSYKWMNAIISTLIAIVIIMLITALAWGERSIELIVTVGLICGLTVGLTLRVMDAFSGEPGDIKLVDSLAWNRVQTIIGLIIGLVAGPFCALSGGLEMLGLGSEQRSLLTFTLGFAVLFAVLMGLEAKLFTETLYPGQRIINSIKNSILILVVVGFIVSLMSILGSHRETVVILGVIGFLIAGYYGAFDVIQHYSLRFIVASSNLLPFRIIPFLDYCTDRIFLRRVGGGYIFVHRLLMEHFAAMEPDTEK